MTEKSIEEKRLQRKQILVRDIPRAVLGYLLVWSDTDAKLCSNLNKQAAKAKEMHDAACKYRVARHFPKAEQGHSIENEEKFKQFWNRIIAICRQNQKAKITERIDLVAQDLGRHATPNKTNSSELRSAASKFLWLMGDHEVRIYDTQAVGALRSINGLKVKHTYAEFYESWETEFRYFNDYIAEYIETAIEENLAKWISHSSTAQPVWQPEEVMSKLWFRHRVFDQLLWKAGGGRHQRHEKI
ncbi:hypothetical protein [Variovorax sp. W2I14]|uniref:hypothetical protein n=1 Tax=Variovorax sp. W2I14 TaxID=3042290 RepID=UPI003D1B82FB